MATSGRISLLVSKDLQTLVTVVKGLEPEVRAQIRKYTKREAEPVWRDEIRSHVTTRLETRVLADTARVAVSDMNVTLKAAMAGKVHGVPASVLAPAAEFGADPNKMVPTRSRGGKTYKRRMGTRFRPPRSRGYVFHPAVREAIPRMASLWLQTAHRTTAEHLEDGAS